MTLDLVFMRPEFFLLFGFLVLLYYGTGGLVTPVAEMITVANYNSMKQKNSLENDTSQTISSEGLGGDSTPLTSSTLGHTFLTLPLAEVERTLTSGKHTAPTAGPNHAASALSLWAIFWSLLCALLLLYTPLQSVFLGGCFQKDAYSLQLGGILFLTAAFVLSVSLGWQKTASIRHTEYIYLAMLALMGQYLLIQTTDLMAMYLCLELQSFSLVVLCGLNYKSAYSIEAAMKYFLLSAFRSCLLLLGIGFLYWQTGETTISHIENLAFRTQSEPSLILLLGVWFVSMGLLWKLAAAPLHFWVPDVYMGAWSSVSLWITVLPKIAVLGFWTHHWHNLWRSAFGNTLAFFRILSMIIGALAPLAQNSLKRLLAYSSIGHMGLLLMPLCSRGVDSVGALWTHMFIYILINLGVWALLMWPMTRPNQPSVKAAGPQFIWDLKALNQSSATAAFRWAVFFVGLRGLPPVYGFLGKAGIIWAALNNGRLATVAVSLLATLVGSVYYLKVLKVCYVDNPTSWATYSWVSSTTAYIVAISVAFMMIGLWHGNFLFLLTHLLSLKV
uniref:NADH dehydrogenase subunit 2 n=1 Tax=Pectinodesmus pectinatus TaxID=91197 RepID=A0A2H4E7C0_9CHLO|nr:NADH dehydrogenase subunit 2 [Pectinodesmus pectinatus]ANG44796.1 NADH dehydrogenase subunit 2 [Pectinodesmus pectinatus]